MDRLILNADLPSTRVIVLPPPFVEAPYCFYILGPDAPDLDLLSCSGIRRIGRQSIIGTVPHWEHLSAMIGSNSATFFYYKEGNDYVPRTPKFPPLPPQPPFAEVGCGWRVIRDAPGEEFAFRRAPVLPIHVTPLIHPYFYACACRPEPGRAVFYGLVTPLDDLAEAGAEVLPNLRGSILEIDREEHGRADGFVMRN